MSENQQQTDSIVNPEDLTHQRDGEGERIAKWMEIGDFGQMKLMPMNYGDVQNYLGDGSEHMVESHAMADLFDDFILEPDLSKASDRWAKDEPGLSPTGTVQPGYVEALKPLVPRDILLALLEVSGIDADVIMQGAGTAQVSVEGN